MKIYVPGKAKAGFQTRVVLGEDLVETAGGAKPKPALAYQMWWRQSWSGKQLCVPCKVQMGRAGEGQKQGKRSSRGWQFCDLAPEVNGITLALPV